MSLSLALCAALLLAAPAAQARVLFSDAEQGAYIIRDSDLSAKLQEAARACAAYVAQQDSVKTLTRARLMGECLNAEKIAERRIAELLGKASLARLQKAEAFEDMAYILLLPIRDEQADAFTPGETPVASGRFSTRLSPGGAK